VTVYDLEKSFSFLSDSSDNNPRALSDSYVNISILVNKCYIFWCVRVIKASESKIDFQGHCRSLD